MKPARRAWQLGAAGLFAAIVVVVLVLVLRASTSVDLSHLPRQSRQVERLLGALPQRGFELGRPSAPATLVEFADPQCPFCGDFARDALPTIVRRYIRPGRLALRVELLSFLGADSVRIARLAAAASLQGRGVDALELAYENQGDENSGYATDDYLRRIARATPGLDVPKAVRATTSSAVQRIVEGASAVASRMGVSSTPRFFVEQRGKAPVELHPSSLTPDAFASALAPYVGG